MSEWLFFECCRVELGFRIQASVLVSPNAKSRPRTRFLMIRMLHSIFVVLAAFVNLTAWSWA